MAFAPPDSIRMLHKVAFGSAFTGLLVCLGGVGYARWTASGDNKSSNSGNKVTTGASTGERVDERDPLLAETGQEKSSA